MNFLRKRIFEPLGMNETGYTVPAQSWPRVVDGASLERRQAGRSAQSGARCVRRRTATAGCNTTAADYAKFIALFLNQGRTPDGHQLVQQATLVLHGPQPHRRRARAPAGGRQRPR